jgi:hypothetical protein
MATLYLIGGQMIEHVDTEVASGIARSLGGQATKAQPYKVRPGVTLTISPVHIVAVEIDENEAKFSYAPGSR